MTGFAILLGFDLLGLLLQSLGVPLPANVIGLLLFTAAVFLGWVKVEWVEASANFLLRHMLLFFVPAIAAIVTFGPLLKQQWVGMVGGMVIGLLASLLVTGLLCQRLTRS